MNIHGGDVYRNWTDLDFSISINPLGVPEAVKAAIHDAVEQCSLYPDMETERLRRAVSQMLAVPEEELLFGNGASELFMAVVHAVRPKKTVIPVPSFYGYEYAAKAAQGTVCYYQMKRENFFCISEDIYTMLTEDIDLLFLANPNNPTGRLLHKAELKRLLNHCRDKGIYVVLDECFIEFSGSSFSMLSEMKIGEFDNLILVRAFTKIFSIPGVRLGYLICRNGVLLDQIKRQLPEWNISCFAQEAGCACAGQTDFIAKTQDYVNKERQFLEEGLRRKGYIVFPSSANFILFYCEQGSLYKSLLNQKILIRNCSNFRGLGDGYYRVAIRTREENERLLRSCQPVSK